MNRRQIEDAIRDVGKRYPEYNMMLSHIRVHKAVEGMTQKVGGPIGVDEHWRLYWDPDTKIEGDANYVRRRMETFILHELGHLNGDDAVRAKELAAGESTVLELIGMDPKREAGPVNQVAWNCSCDARINAQLRKLAWTETDGLVFPESLDESWAQIAVQTPEWYYVKLRGKADPSNDSDGDGDSDSSAGNGAGNKSHSCGSVAHGQPHEWEDPVDDECLTPDEQRSVIEATERAIAQKMADGEPLGDPTEAIEREDTTQGIGTEAAFPMLCNPDKIRNHYNQQLWLDTVQKQLYRKFRRSRRTWRQPHPRVAGLPGVRNWPKQAVIVCDISGSIEELSVKRSFQFIDRIFGRGFDIRIVACDTQAHIVTDRKARYSGGGTDMGEGVRFAAQHFPKAGVIIVITDGGTPWPESNPARCPVVVMSWAREGPDWAENIPMPGLTDQFPKKPNWES